MTAYVTAATGNWSTTTNWTPNGTPGNGDTITLNHNITMDSSRTIGTSGASGTNAVTVASGKVLTISTGTFTLRGDCLITDGDGIVISAGAGLEFDSSAAGSPSTTKYELMLGNSHGSTATLVVNGSSGSRSFVRSNAGGGNGWINDNNTAGHFLASGLIRATYCDFTRIGDATNHAIQTSPSSASNVFSLDNCIFDACGDIFKFYAINATATYSVTNCTFKNSVQAQCLQVENSNLMTTGGVRTISGCVFDKIIYMYAGAGFTISNCVLYQGYDALGGGLAQDLTVTGCFVRSTSAIGDEIGICGNLKNSFMFFDDSTYYNPHWVTALTNSRDQEISGNVFEANNANTTPNEEGDCILIYGSTSAACKVSILNNIVLPNAANKSSGTLFTALGDANTSIVADHNTVHSGHLVAQGAAVGETYTGFAGMLRSFRSNIFWSVTTGGFKLYDSGTNDSVTDLVTTRNANFNAGYNLSAGSNLKGYDALEFSSGTGSPGADDIDGDPQFVDSTADLAKWDTSLGGGGTAANAITELSKRNESGYNTAYTVAALVAYIQAKFTVAKTALFKAGHDAKDIGAVSAHANDSTGLGDFPFRSSWYWKSRGKGKGAMAITQQLLFSDQDAAEKTGEQKFFFDAAAAAAGTDALDPFGAMGVFGI